MIKDKIYEFININEDSPIPPEILDSFKADIVHGLERQMFSEKEEKGRLRLSVAGKCPRQVFYSMTRPDLARPLEPRVKLTFLFGDITEAMVVALAKSAGVNLHSEQKEVEFEGVKGHIDGIYTDSSGKDFLWECKSMSDFSFKRVTFSGIDNAWGYLSQVNVYMDSLGVDKAVFTCMNKNTGHLEEVTVDKDRKVLAEAKENIRKIREAEQSGKCPERKFDFEDEVFRKKPTGKLKLPVQCSYCPYVEECWKGKYDLHFKNNKPIYYKKGV